MTETLQSQIEAAAIAGLGWSDLPNMVAAAKASQADPRTNRRWTDAINTARAALSSAAQPVPGVKEEEALAYKFQNIMAQKLKVDADSDIAGVGPASFAMARHVLATLLPSQELHELPSIGGEVVEPWGSDEDSEPKCHFSGRCEPLDRTSDITCCEHCGSEMHKIGDDWLNHDHPLVLAALATPPLPAHGTEPTASILEVVEPVVSTEETRRLEMAGWPEYLMLRDTTLHDDLGGGGQRIYTTAGRGYIKVKYVRHDLTSLPVDSSALKALLAFAQSFHFTVTDSFYKDAYLGIHEPDSVTIRLGNHSPESAHIAKLEARRKSVIDAALSSQERTNG